MMMRNGKYEAIFLGIALLSLVIFVGYLFMKGGQTNSDKTVYSTDLLKLQSDFNADKGKVRLVLLLSPT